MTRKEDDDRDNEEGRWEYNDGDNDGRKEYDDRDNEEKRNITMMMVIMTEEIE